MSEAKWNTETDLVIIGAGLAGYCAALEAAHAGANCLLLEKLSVAGGTSGMSGGLFAFAGTDLQNARGVDDSAARLYDDLRRTGKGVDDELLVRKYCDHQLETYQWLKGHGVQFGAPEASGGQSVPRSHTSNAQQVIDILASRAAQTKGRITTMMNTPALRLVREGHAGRVTGVHASRDGLGFAIHARKGVILASGGFSRNQMLMECFAPQQVGVNTVCGEGCTGDGLLMAWRLGASLRDMGYVKSTFGNHPDAGSVRHRVLFPVYRGAIAVNRHGRRFVNESFSYKMLGDACLQQPGKTAYQIFDQTVMDRTTPVVTFDFREALEAGFVIQAATLDELGRTIGVDERALSETVTRYNEGIRRGLPDEFGRTAMTNQFGSLVVLDKPPFYAYPSMNVMLGTYCGITINDSMQVLDVFNETISGLYAAGEVHGGFHGAAYMTGTGLGKAAIFARLAAANALAS